MDLKTEEYVQKLKAKGLTKNFCPVPFSTLLFEADGQVCMCRQKGNYFSVGDIQKQSIEEIWNGEKMTAIRQEFLSGHVMTCAQEIKRDACHLAFDRMYLLDKIDLTAKQKSLPIRISPNFNGRCNLECPMCRVWKQPNGLYDKIGFWKDLEEKIIPHLIEIDNFSGEPFIQKDTFRLIDLASQVNPQILWSFTTNGQWIFNQKIKSYLEKINIKNFIFSIDSLDSKTFSKIRKNGSLQKTLNSFLSIKEYLNDRILQNRSFNLVINFTLQKDNWNEISKILQFKKTHKALLSIRCLAEPAELSLLTLDSKSKIEILNDILEKVSEEDLPSTVRAVLPLLEKISALEKKLFLSRYLKKIDSAKSNQQRLFV